MSTQRGLGIWKSLAAPKDTPPEPTGFGLVGEANIITHRKLSEYEKDISGVVCLKIKEINLDTGALLSEESVANQHLFCTVQIRNFISRTNISKSVGSTFKYNHSFHYPVKVVPSRSHPFNFVNINVLSFYPDKPETKIGNVSFHLHDIIQTSPSDEVYAISGVHLTIGSIKLEITFSYGAFGYGLSPQLADEDLSPDELIQYSLFPRINPLKENCDPDSIVLHTQAVVHPNFIPFRDRVYLSHGKDLVKQLEQLHETLPPRNHFLSTLEQTEKIREKYYDISDRSSRLLYLHNLLQKSQYQAESVAEEQSGYEDQGFPAKKYIKFLSSSTVDEAE